jgi:hypothetical protein
MVLHQPSSFLPAAPQVLRLSLTGKYQSFVRDLNFWSALHTPWQFFQKV